MSLQSIAEGLGGAKPTAGGYLCRCPCHEDRSASLSLTLGEGKRLVVNCFAGCDPLAVKDEIKRRGLVPAGAQSSTALPARKSASGQRGHPEGTKHYEYRDIAGNMLCRKVKLPDKTIWAERWEDNQWKPKLNGMAVPLYNIQAVAAADTVYLCEGEKDAETLISRGFCASTNHNGAGARWTPQWADALKGKTVIIIPDQDDAGRKRIAIVTKALQGTVKELRVFLPKDAAEKTDLTDWVNAGLDPATILSQSTLLESAKKQKHAGRDDYFELFENSLSAPRRCIFNNKLMYWDEDEQLWNPAINQLSVLKSDALFENESRQEKKFQVSHIESHFFKYEGTKERELLVDIPDWDGTDRISEMAYLATMRDSSVTVEAFSELLKDWCAKVFLRFQDPINVQNRILILQGGQGVGKDTWTDMLVGGLGQFCVPLAVLQDDKDTFLSLHRGLVMKISEFDRTAKTESSTIKDMITRPNTNLRAPYAEDAKQRVCRCSFISSANVQDLLKDHTGSRRYLIFEIEHIKYAYVGWDKEKRHEWQMQCLAQMQHLAEQGYAASPDSERQMREYLERNQPTDPAEELAEQFIVNIKRDLLGATAGEMLFTDQRVTDLINRLARENGMNHRGIKSMLRRKLGKCKRIAGRRLWVLDVPEPDVEIMPIVKTPQQERLGV